MSLKGGYQIIDLKNVPFDSADGTVNTFPNYFSNLVNSHAKMIILSGLNMDGVEYNDYEVIFYEIQGDNGLNSFQCILRRIWDTSNYNCIVKYLNVYSDDTVKITVDSFTYEILPDDALNADSENAVQNKVITENINRLDNEDKKFLYLDGTRKMTGNLNMGSKRITSLSDPTTDTDAVTRKYLNNQLDRYALKENVGNVGFTATSPYFTGGVKGDARSFMTNSTITSIPSLASSFDFTISDIEVNSKLSNLLIGVNKVKIFAIEEPEFSSTLSGGTCKYLFDGDVVFTPTGFSVNIVNPYFDGTTINKSYLYFVWSM